MSATDDVIEPERHIPMGRRTIVYTFPAGFSGWCAVCGQPFGYNAPVGHNIFGAIIHESCAE